MIMKILIDEFYLKLFILISGVIYWIYGFMPVADKALTLLFLAGMLFALVYYFETGSNGFNKTVYALIFLSALGTLINTENKKVTVFLLIFICVLVVFLSSCAGHKKKDVLKGELDIIALMFILVSFVIVIGTLYTYVRRVSVVYSYPGVLEADLILGIDQSTGALVGIFSNANAASSVLVQSMGFVLYYTHNKNMLRLPGLAYTFILFVTIYLTRSRGGLVGAMIVLAMYFFILIRKRINHLDTNSIMLICILLMMILMSVFLAKGISVNTVIQRKSYEMGNSTAARLLLWKAGLRTVTADPGNFFFGIGGNIREMIALYVDKSLPTRLYGNMHNIYIQTLVEFGFFGLLFLLICIVRYVFFSLKMFLDHFKSNEDMAPLIGLLCALVIMSCVESDLYLGKTFLSTTFWIVGGYVYRIESLRKQEGIDEY